MTTAPDPRLYDTPPGVAVVIDARGTHLELVDADLAAALAGCDAEADTDPRLARLAAVVRDGALAAAINRARQLRRTAPSTVDYAAARAVEEALLDAATRPVPTLPDPEVLARQAVLLAATSPRRPA